MEITFFYSIFSLNCENMMKFCTYTLMYIRPRLKRLHLIFHKFSTEL